MDKNLTKPRIKILLATYNGENYIIEQIDSLINQINVDIDIIVSDDGSIDKTTSIIRDNYPKIRLTINNPGTGSAANNFLKMLTELDFEDEFGYVAFSDQDDIWHKEKLIKAIEFLGKENATLYCSNLTKWDTENNTFVELKKDFKQKKFDYLFEGGSAGCTYVFSKKFAKELSNFLKKVDSSDWKEFSHDWLIYFYARSRKYNVFIDRSSYIHYRIHSSNVHGHLNKLSWSTIQEKSRKVLSGYYQEHIKNYKVYFNENSEEYKIYKSFMGNYFQRNYLILKYNTQLMRDNKKLFVFMLLNLIKFK